MGFSSRTIALSRPPREYPSFPAWLHPARHRSGFGKDQVDLQEALGIGGTPSSEQSIGPMPAKQTIYYLTGMNGRLAEGLGGELSRRGLQLSGRELYGEFRRLTFQEQVNIVAGDLVSEHWRDDARVIANSFGAYLFLHAQAQLPGYIGKVLLLSPIVGEFANDELMMGFIPPRSQRLTELIRGGEFNSPVHCEIHVGSEDWQSNPNAVQQFGDAVRASVFIVEGAGHSLPKSYVNRVLDKWLLSTDVHARNSDKN